jgi:FlaG/FlaF family flagellin (archaellin)
MKGISTIVATILIVIIVVALVSLTYTFATGLLSTTTKSAETGVTTTTMRMDQRASFATDPICKNVTNGWNITFSLRHDGATYKIKADEINAFFGSDELNITDLAELVPGKVKTFTGQNKTPVDWSDKTDSFTASVPASPISKTITCPELT